MYSRQYELPPQILVLSPLHPPQQKLIVSQGALHRFLQVSRARLRQEGGAGAPRAEDRAAEAMRCRLAEARVLWGKGETDGALRAARAVATRLKASVVGGATSSGGSGSGGAVIDRHEEEEQRLLSEVR